jgi:hypothetical protein
LSVLVSVSVSVSGGFGQYGFLTAREWRGRRTLSSWCSSGAVEVGVVCGVMVEKEEKEEEW